MTTVPVQENRLSTTAASHSTTVDKSQRLFYGWIILPIAMAGLIATSPGQTFGVSIFNEPMRVSLGLSHGQLAAAYMLGTLLAAVPIAYIGAMMDRYGLKRTLVLAVLLFGIACLATSLVSGWWSLFVAFFLLRLLGPGALAFLSGNVLSFWFHRRLGMAEGIRHLGMAGAMVVIPTLNLWLVDHFGWRGAYTFLGLAVWGVMLPLLVFLFHNRPEDVGQTLDGRPPDDRNPHSNTFSHNEDRSRPTDRHSQTENNPSSNRAHETDQTETNPHPVLPSQKAIDSSQSWNAHHGLTLKEALRTRSFWIVSGGTSMFGLIHTAVFFSIVAIFLDRGLTEQHAATMLTVFATGLALMQLIGGTLADRFPAPSLLALALTGLTVSMVMVSLMASIWMALAAGIVMGVSQGLYFGTSNPLWARYFGRQHLGKIRGVLVTVNVASSSLGPLLFGTARDLWGSYDTVLTAFVVLPIPLILLSLLATPPERKFA